jgi:hypothetical protein
MEDLRRNCGELATISAVLYDVSPGSTNKLGSFAQGLTSQQRQMVTATFMPLASRVGKSIRIKQVPWRHGGGQTYSNVSMVG